MRTHCFHLGRSLYCYCYFIIFQLVFRLVFTKSTSTNMTANLLPRSIALSLSLSLLLMKYYAFSLLLVNLPCCCCLPTCENIVTQKKSSSVVSPSLFIVSLTASHSQVGGDHHGLRCRHRHQRCHYSITYRSKRLLTVEFIWDIIFDNSIYFY